MANVTAYESALQLIPGIVAGEDLSSYQFCPVKFSSGLAVHCATGGENALGILQDKPDASGIAAAVAFGGISQVKLGDTVSQLNRLVVNAASKLVAQTDPDESVVAIALSDGVVNDLIPAILVFGQSGLSDLADGKIWIGDAAGAAAAKTPSGDATMTREGVITVTDVTVGSDAAGDVLYKSSATALARLAKSTGGRRLRMKAAGDLPTWDNGKIFKALLTGMTAADDPSLSEFDHTVAPGTTGAHCYAQLPDGSRLGYWVLGAGQTILGPVGATSGIDVACDQTDNEGLEIFSNAFCADGAPLAVGFDAAFYMLIKFAIQTINGCDDLFIGFRTRELVNATFENYDTYFGLGLNTAATPGALKVRNELNGGGADNTDTTQTIASATDLQVKVLVAANGVATVQHDAAVPGTLAAPTATAAFTFDDGDQLVPTFRFLHANAAQAGTIVIKDWEVGYQ